MNIWIPEIHAKDWGREFWLVNNEFYCGKILEVKRKYQCSIHYHKNKDETFYLQSGLVIVQFHGEVFEEARLIQDRSIHVPRGVPHRFIGVAELSNIIEISTPHEESDSYRLETGGKVPDKEWERLQEFLFLTRK